MGKDGEKKRQEDNGGVDGNGGKPSTADGGQAQARTETEEKVNQFFEILRRVRVAAHYFERDNGAGNGRLASKKRKRSESFRLGNTVEANGVGKGECEGRTRGGRVGSPIPGLDLNSKPEPDGVDP